MCAAAVRTACTLLLLPPTNYFSTFVLCNSLVRKNSVYLSELTDGHLWKTAPTPTIEARVTALTSCSLLVTGAGEQARCPPLSELESRVSKIVQK